MNMKKYIFAGLMLVAFVTAGFAQETPEESQIELPDLTTVVSGSNQQEDSAPAPDFDDVLELPFNSGDVVPVLPSASTGSDGEMQCKRIFMPKVQSVADTLFRLLVILKFLVFMAQIRLRFLLHMNLPKALQDMSFPKATIRLRLLSV